MPVVFACIAPHGAEVIPELAGEMLKVFEETRKGMEELGRLMKKHEPETVVLATPHGLRLDGTIGVVTSEYTEGVLEANGKSVRMRLSCDRSLAKGISEHARKVELPVVSANYGTSEGPASCMPMDWGAFIPLWFFGGQTLTPPQVVLVTPSREIPLQSLVRFGKIVSEVAGSSKKRIAFVASADQGHCHQVDGPYGFNVASAKFDDIVKRAVSQNNLDSLLNLTKQFIEDAKPDSIWQIAILKGILERSPMNGRLLSYQVPTYFGILCAAFEPS